MGPSEAMQHFHANTENKTIHHRITAVLNNVFLTKNAIYCIGHFTEEKHFSIF